MIQTMKHIILSSIIILCCQTTSYAQDFLGGSHPDEGAPYLDKVLDADIFLTPPPSLTSGAWYNDFYYYQWGKEQRQNDSIRNVAIADYHGTTLEYLEALFSPAYGMEISATHTPELHQLLSRCKADARAANGKAKNIYERLRPFVQMGEESIEPEYDEEERAAFSYPSGHTTRCYVPALVLSMVNPDATELILRTARDYTINRVICGHHYKSDTEASVYVAMAVVAKLHGSADFMAQYAKAVEEFKSLSGTGIAPVYTVKAKSDDSYTSLSGVRHAARPTESGVYLHQGNKIAIK